MTPDCPEDPPLPDPTTTPGLWMWGLLFLAVVAYELWAVVTHRLTLTQTVRRSRRWFRWSLGLGFLTLLWHLFVAKRLRQTSACVVVPHEHLAVDAPDVAVLPE